MIGTTIGNYRIVRQLGVGGMGAVYEGVDVMLERAVAIKVLRPELAIQPELIERFRAEAVTLAKLSHPNIAMLYAFFESGGQYFMVMEFVRGRTLESILEQSGPMAPAAAADMMRQVLDAMAHAHGMGVLHRDIKPANIMTSADGTVKVTDFGIARILGSARMTREGKIIGTLEYIAPERIQGEEADPRSDLYSAGVVLFEAVAGRLPFTSTTDFGLMEAHLRQAPPSLPALGVKCPPELEAVVRRALEKNPQDRFRSAAEFRDTLGGGRPSGVVTVPMSVATPPTRLAGAPLPGSAPMQATRLAAPPAAASPAAASRNKLVVPLIAVAGAVLLLVLGVFGALRLRDALSGSPKQGETGQQAATGVPQTPAAPAAQPQQQAPSAFVTPPSTSAEFTPMPISPPANAEPAKSGRTQAVNPIPQPAPAVPARVHQPSAPAPARPAEQTPVPSEPVRTETAPTPPPPPPPAQPVAEPKPAPAPMKTIRAGQKLYIEKMPNDLDRHIKREIAEQLSGRIQVVNSPEAADGVMHGSAERRDGLGGRLLLGMKSSAIGSVTITDAAGSRLLWTGEAGDSKTLTGAVKRGGIAKVAERLVEKLKEALVEK